MLPSLLTSILRKPWTAFLLRQRWEKRWGGGRREGRGTGVKAGWRGGVIGVRGGGGGVTGHACGTNPFILMRAIVSPQQVHDVSGNQRTNRTSLPASDLTST